MVRDADSRNNGNNKLFMKKEKKMNLFIDPNWWYDSLNDSIRLLLMILIILLPFLISTNFGLLSLGLVGLYRIIYFMYMQNEYAVRD
jgi:hypothetical protein